MTTNSFLCVWATSVVVLVSMLTGGGGAQTCTSMTGAYSNSRALYLFFGNRVTRFNFRRYRSNGLRNVKRVFQRLPDIHVDAAYRPILNPANIFLTSGNSYYRMQYSRLIRGPIDMRLKFPISRTFKHGIDASASQGNLVFYFGGCRVIRRHLSGLRHVSNIKTMGLPCNVDAAWSSNGRIIVTKGPFAWKLDGLRRTAKLHCFYCRPAVS